MRQDSITVRRAGDVWEKSFMGAVKATGARSIRVWIAVGRDTGIHILSSRDWCRKDFRMYMFNGD